MDKRNRMHSAINAATMNTPLEMPFNKPIRSPWRLTANNCAPTLRPAQLFHDNAYFTTLLSSPRQLVPAAHIGDPLFIPCDHYFRSFGNLGAILAARRYGAAGALLRINHLAGAAGADQ